MLLWEYDCLIGIINESLICERSLYDAKSLNSGNIWGSKNVVTKSPDLTEAKPVYTCLGVKALIWTINYMITLPIADIPATAACFGRGWNLLAA